MSSSSLPTLGLVGCGLWGRAILRDLKALGHAVWVAETDPGVRTAIAGIADGVVAHSHELPRVDGVIVATPASSHFANVSDVLARNVPILCEKPLTTDADEARRLVDLAGDRLFAAHIWCYHPGVEALADLVRTNELGPLLGLRSTRTNWASPRRDVDSVWNLAPHDISLAQFILGTIPAPRYAQAEVLDGRCVGMIGILGSNPWVVFEVSNRFREKRREIRLHCRDGVAVLPDADSGQIEITRPGPGLKPEVEVRVVERESALVRELRAFCSIWPEVRRCERQPRRVSRWLKPSKPCDGWRDCRQRSVMTSPTLTATVVIPTSIDRGPTLALAVDSVLRQSVRDVEVFIIGDGAHDVTRETARGLERADPRVRFFDHPKHERRGEPYRHLALQEARGRIVCYLCDRDLYLPDHVETMSGLLAAADFATAPVIRLPGDEGGMMHGLDLADSEDRQKVVSGRLVQGLALSFLAHTLAAYRQLGEGWTQTPTGTYTDVYFARKFAGDSRIRCVTGAQPTVLFFPRGTHPGLSTEQRHRELVEWHARLSSPGEIARIREEFCRARVREIVELQRRLRQPLLYKAKPVNWARVVGFFRNLPKRKV